MVWLPKVRGGTGGVQEGLSGGLEGSARCPFMPIVGSLLDRTGPHPPPPIRTPPLPHRLLHFTLFNSFIQTIKTSQHSQLVRGTKMKIRSASATVGSSKRRLSNRGLGGVLREQRAKLYIIRRCVVMLLCWHD
ncbi:hypothetical protein HRI_003663300 [Hibiscus trionum]|uniref:ROTUNDIFOLIA like 8 n=1 Tax=Hibiscus trionum TaxID=183268 RepID=A0A9W7IR63_HIBTR|nr:hypothetical protein HRI_003663300 [Hibiscus trionum]